MRFQMKIMTGRSNKPNAVIPSRLRVIVNHIHHCNCTAQWLNISSAISERPRNWRDLNLCIGHVINIGSVPQTYTSVSFESNQQTWSCTNDNRRPEYCSRASINLLIVPVKKLETIELHMLMFQVIQKNDMYLHGGYYCDLKISKYNANTTWTACMVKFWIVASD